MGKDLLKKVQAEKAELSTRLSEMRARLSELEIVERYMVAAQADENDAPVGEKPTPLPKSTKKRDAIRRALEALGGRARLTHISQWLRERGYGSSLRPNIMYNGLYTTMKRETVLFRKVEGKTGMWELIEHPTDGGPSSDNQKTTKSVNP